jgi:hypothetical protein
LARGQRPLSLGARFRFDLAAYRLGVGAGLLGALDGPHGGGEQTAEVGLLADDLRVVFRAAGAVEHVRELVQVDGTADAPQVALLLEQLGEDDRVGRLVFTALCQQRAPDRLVRGPVKGVIAQHVPDPVDDGSVVHAGTEHRAFGIVVERCVRGIRRLGADCGGGWRV